MVTDRIRLLSKEKQYGHHWKDYRGITSKKMAG